MKRVHSICVNAEKLSHYNLPDLREHWQSLAHLELLGLKLGGRVALSVNWLSVLFILLVVLRLNLDHFQITRMIGQTHNLAQDLVNQVDLWCLLP